MMSERRITFTLNRLVNALNASADHILRTKFSLTYSQFLFLVVLENSGTVSSKEFAKHLGVSSAAISRRISWFAQRGLIETGAFPEDRRVVSLTITDHGRDLLSQTSAVLEDAFREGFESLDTVNLDELNGTLLRVLEHLAHNESLEHHT